MAMQSFLANGNDTVNDAVSQQWSSIRDQQLFARSRGIITSIPDKAITATDSHNENHGPQYVKLGAPKVSNKSHAWCAQKDAGGHLTIDLGSSYIVTGIHLAARGDYPQWVTKVNIKTSNNGIDWTDHGDFLGVYEQKTSVKRKLNRSTVASFVRIKPLAYHAHPSMRVDVLVYDDAM